MSYDERDPEALARDWLLLKVELIETFGLFRYARALGVGRTVMVPRAATLDQLAMILCREFERGDIEHLYAYELPRESAERTPHSHGLERFGDLQTLRTDVQLSELDLREHDRIDHIFNLAEPWRHRILLRPWNSAALSALGRQLARQGAAQLYAGRHEQTRVAVPFYVAYKRRGTASAQHPEHDARRQDGAREGGDGLPPRRAYSSHR